LTSGGVDCWGFNGSYGNLGDGATTDSAVPEEVVGVGGSGALSGVTALAGDGEGYCALLTSGGVDCWGYGEYGEIGDGSFTDSDVPEMVEGVGGTGTLAGVESIVGFGNGYCALLNSGQVACWGEGTFGSLGDGSFSDSAMPMLVEGADGTGTLAGVVYLTSGYGESECALLTSGGLLCWGRGDYGQLGDGTFYTSGNLGSAVPVAVEAVGGTGTLGRVVSLTQGCALLTSGAADCWGRGANGQLGNGAFDDSAAPVIVKGLGGSGTLTDITSIISAATGYCATFASSGTVNCWGGGGTGELGDGIFYTTGNGGSPVPVATEGP
jgi:alpha-tubulin suppressor-like RCC1 family protein